MSEQNKTVQANKSQDPDHQILETLCKDHYLVLQEKEQWVKSVKVSKPTLRLISEGDMQSFLEDKYFEKHEITLVILHDPTLSGSEKKLNTSTVTKKKEEYVKELADLLEISVSDIDPKLTIKALQGMIEEETEKKKAAAAAGGGSADPD